MHTHCKLKLFGTDECHTVALPTTTAKSLRRLQTTSTSASCLPKAAGAIKSCEKPSMFTMSARPQLLVRAVATNAFSTLSAASLNYLTPRRQALSLVNFISVWLSKSPRPSFPNITAVQTSSTAASLTLALRGSRTFQSPNGGVQSVSAVPISLSHRCF